MEYTYTISSDIDSQQVNSDSLEQEIKAVLEDSGYQYLNIKSGKVICFFDSALSAADKLVLDEALRTHSGEAVKQMRIVTLAREEFKGKPYQYIIYKKELDNEIGLKAKFTYTKEGFVTTEYFQAYNADTQAFTNPVLRVEEEYEVFDDNYFSSGKSVKSRNKKWYYADTDGVYETIPSRVVPKSYTDTNQKLKEGNRRRGNIISELSKQVATVLIATGLASDAAVAEAMIGAFIVTYDHDLGIYQRYAIDSIFTSIDTDITFPWLNQVIPNVALPSIDISTAAGLTLRTYSIERLKGEI